jgi:lysozyme
MTFYFIDISRYNGAINYAQVKAGGIQGVVCKATEGTPAQTASATSAYFQGAAAGIKRAGFPIRGGYHWLRPGNYAAQAANFYNVLVAGYGTINGLVCQLDAEGTDVRLDDVQGFVRSWNLLTGNYPLCGYFPKWYWQGKGVAAGQLLPLVGGRWWQSAYVTGSGTYLALADKIASGWDPWAVYSPLILQYTSTANIPGDPGVCDVNQTKGTVAQFLAVATRVPKPPPPPKPAVTPEENEVKLVMEDGDNSVYLHGVAPTGKYRIYVTSAEFDDMVTLYGAPVTVDDLDHCGPVVTPAAKSESPDSAQTERHNRRAEA